MSNLSDNGNDVSTENMGLSELAVKINLYHDSVNDRWYRSLQKAQDTGNLLIQAQKKVKWKGLKWTQWLEHNVKLSLRQAQKYMKIARDWDPEKDQKLSALEQGAFSINKVSSVLGEIISNSEDGEEVIVQEPLQEIITTVEKKVRISRVERVVSKVKKILDKLKDREKVQLKEQLNKLFAEQPTTSLDTNLNQLGYTEKRLGL